MARSGHKLCDEGSKLVMLLCVAAAAMSVASGGHGDVVTYSYPAFNANTTGDLVEATISSILTSAALLFEPEGLDSKFNASEGFILLSDAIDVWRAGGDNDGVQPDRVASFNTSFTVASGAAPVAFVVLRDSYPPLFGRGGLRGAANYSELAGAPVPTNATAGGLAAVEVGPVMSYGPDTPAAGLNVTVTVTSRGGGCAVWIEHDAAARRLSVYVTGAGGEPRRPATSLLDVPLGYDGWHWTTETALVGFFAGKVSDIIVGVRDWELTVERISGDGKKGTAWWVILLAVLGSVAAAAAVVSAAVCCVRARRRRQANMEPKI